MSQGWFAQGIGGNESSEVTQSSLLADWNSYVASQDESSSLGLRLDLESAVRSANDTVSGTFYVLRCPSSALTNAANGECTRHCL